jgi:hypothetical protein
VGAGPLVGAVHQHHFLDELAVDLAAERGRVDLDVPTSAPWELITGTLIFGSGSLVSVDTAEPFLRKRGRSMPAE